MQLLDRQFGVEFNLRLVLDLFEDLLERVHVALVFRLHVEHDVAVHLHEAAIAVPSESFVLRLFGQCFERFFVEADVEHRVHHAGHRLAGSRAAGDQQRILRRAEFGPHDGFDVGQRGFDRLLQVFGVGAVVGVVVVADFGREGEAGGNRQADVAHFGQVGPFASQEIAHRGVAFRLACAEGVNVLVVFGHACNLCRGSFGRRMLSARPAFPATGPRAGAQPVTAGSASILGAASSLRPETGTRA